MGSVESLVSDNGQEAFRKVLSQEANPHTALELGNAEHGLAKLVLTLIELLRRLLEEEAMRRVDSGQLVDEEIEALGLAFEDLDNKMHELKQFFGFADQDLNVDLGPLGNLL